MPSLGPPNQNESIKRCIYRGGKPCNPDCAKYDEKYQACADLAMVIATRQLTSSVDQLLNHLMLLLNGMYEDADFCLPPEMPTFPDSGNYDDDVPF